MKQTTTPEAVPARDEADAESLLAPGRRLRWPGVLRHTHFRHIWIAAFASSIGSWMEQTTSQWIVTEQTGDPKWLGLLGAAPLLPSVLLGIPAGYMADHVNRRAMLLITQSLMLVIALALTIMSFAQLLTPVLLVAIGFTQGAVLAFNVAAWTTLTPSLVPKKDLPKAIALNSTQFNAARIIGPAIAGALIGSFGPSWAFLLNSISFLAVIGAVWSTPSRPVHAKDDATAWQRLREGLLFVWINRGARMTLLAVSAFALLATPTRHQLSIFVVKVYGRQEGAFGAMLGLLGAGAVLGGLALQLIPHRWTRRRLIPASITGGGLCIAAFGLADSMSVGAPLIVLTGVFWVASFSSCWAGLQTLAPDRLRGRVMSVAVTVTFAAIAVGNLLIGRLASGIPDPAAGPQLAIALAGAILTLAGAVFILVMPPDVDAAAEDEHIET